MRHRYYVEVPEKSTNDAIIVHGWSIYNVIAINLCPIHFWADVEKRMDYSGSKYFSKTLFSFILFEC